MDSELELQRSLSEPNGLFIFSPGTLKEVPYSITSSAASLIHLPPCLPFPNGKSIRHSLSVDHFGTKWQVPKSMKVLRRSQLSPSLNKSSSSSSSSSDDNACHQDSNDLHYSRFDDSPSRIESSPSHIYLERMMLTSIPRRKEFSEQFRDLAQLHENSDIPRAKWDDASRLFPKQFGLPPSVAISIWKQVDSDGDMMLTESEYCLAAHLANKYFTTGFSLLASPSHAPTPTQRHRGDTNADASTSSSSSQSSTSRQQHNRQSRQLGRHRGNRRRQPPLNGQDAVYLDNDEDDSHDLLLSPNPRPLVDRADGQPTPWSSSSNSRSPSPTYKAHPASLDQVVDEVVDEEFEEEEYLDDDDHKVVSDDEIGVRALLPTSNSLISAIHCRHSHGADVNGKRRIKKREKVGGIGRSRRKSSSDSSSSSSSPTSSSSSQISNSSEEEGESFSSSEEGSVSNSEDSSASQSSSLSSSPERAVPTRMESVYSTSPSVKVIDPIEVLSKVTHRSIDEILLLSAHRRRRLLVSLVRAAKSTNYMLLRLNNELAGELQELCDQHTNLNAQVRHLSELGP
nr:serine rich repeat protein [Hymenolepis microstoma]